jgi:hypothetical protein
MDESWGHSGKWSKPDKDKQHKISLTCGTLIKVKLGSEYNGGYQEIGVGGKRYWQRVWTFNYRQTSTGDQKYSIVTIVNNALWYTTPAKRVDLKCFYNT